MPAKFRIAVTLPAALDPDTAGEEELTRELDRLTPVFLRRRRRIRSGAEELGPPVAGARLLEVRRAFAERRLRRRTFCRRECRIDRSRPGRTGARRRGAAFPAPRNVGEELVFRGLEGSGTIVFTSCDMRCAFCRSGDVPGDGRNGDPLPARHPATLAWRLRREGRHDIDWVGGEPVLHPHRIVRAIALLGRGFEPAAEDRARIRPLLADRWNGWPERAGRGAGVGGFDAPI